MAINEPSADIGGWKLSLVPAMFIFNMTNTTSEPVVKGSADNALNSSVNTVRRIRIFYWIIMWLIQLLTERKIMFYGLTHLVGD